jgi:hypothetical protein
VPASRGHSIGRLLALVAVALACLAACAAPPRPAVASTPSRPGVTASPTFMPTTSPTGPSLPGGDAACPVTVFETIPPNDIVGWQVAEWQAATTGVWGHPYLDVYDPRYAGFSSANPAAKILWWLQDPSDLPMVLTIESIPPGAFRDQVTTAAPGPQRHDRPTGFTTPPPGCYAIGVRIGTTQGRIVERVLP